MILKPNTDQPTRGKNIGIFSDTHGKGAEVIIPYALEFKKRNVDIVVNNGDIYDRDIEAMKVCFPDITIIAALTNDQVDFYKKKLEDLKDKNASIEKKYGLKKLEDEIRSMDSLFNEIKAICSLSQDQQQAWLKKAEQLKQAGMLIEEKIKYEEISDEIKKMEADRKSIQLFFPSNWHITIPGPTRIVPLPGGDMSLYVGHKLAFNYFISKPESELETELLEFIRKYDSLRLFTTGHGHHQFAVYLGLCLIINSGAASEPTGIAGGWEFAIFNTLTKRLILSRIPRTESTKPYLKIAVITDSLDISEDDPGFWKKLAEVLKNDGVTHIVHCGNIAKADIGRPELKKFKVYFNPVLGDERLTDYSAHKNWFELKPDADDKENCFQEIEGYSFLVRLNFGLDIGRMSEAGMGDFAKNMIRKHPSTYHMFCRVTPNTFCEELPKIMILKPGNIHSGRCYATLELPRNEFTFDRVPYDPLPLVTWST
ncbi:MAG: hypothetical protein NTZ97_04680 [Candidatus Moranbacteria bacterium]|nr:hypothetical protein [Candidatus Moranbacteria bacterium]